LRNLRHLLWPRPKRVRTAFALGGALLLCTASAAHAGIALNTIDRNVTHARDGAHVRATGPIGCTRGERIAITLRVSQAATGARARGRWAGRCTGDVQHWKVRARARGHARFAGGRGNVCAVGRTRAAGRVTDARRWCRRVSVSTRAANAMDEDGRGLDWRPCGGRFQCASLKVPLDYSRPRWRTIEIPVLKLPATDPARRIGTAIGGAGGPGQSGIDLLRNVGETAFAPLNERFDLVTFDQRGVGTIDCGPLPDPDPGFAEPFDVDTKLVARRAREIGRRCLDRNPVLLPYVTTGNAARDMDRLRAAVGERKLTYLGGSYGTMLGATYASLFPRNVRAMALDGPLDVDVVTRRPLEDMREYVVNFEGALDRFAMQCAASPACGFGGDDPEQAIDALLERLDRDPLPLPGQPGAALDGDRLRDGLLRLMYVPSLWPATAAMLAQLEQGVTDLASELVGIDLFGLDQDAYLAIRAADSDHPRGLAPYVDAVRHTWAIADHFWWADGYSAATFGFWPVEGRGAYRGPARAPRASVPPLIIAVRHDPATSYRHGQRLAQELGARLLTVHGDGHTSIRNPCVLQLAKRYLEDLELPAPGVTCTQPKPFDTTATRPAALRRLVRRERRVAALTMPVPALVGR
jgi:pimeloyl-ACP methyl ester carboxylesterase